MPRPTNKTELIHASNDNFYRLMNLIRSLPGKVVESDFPPGTLNRNIRDVLAHLHHWHLLFFDWYKVGMSGNKPSIPAEGYTWKTTPELNKWIRDHYKNQDFEEVKALLISSHASISQIIASHTDQELFEKKRFNWTGTTSLGAYLIGSTSSHYDWAFKLIKKKTKEIANPV